jgi:hypothetical protein
LRQNQSSSLSEISQTAEHLLNRYASNLEPQSASTARDDLHGLSNLADKIRAAKALLQSALDWLLANAHLPSDVKTPAADQVKEEILKLNDAEAELGDLEKNLSDELVKLEEMKGQRDEIRGEIASFKTKE